MAADDLDLTEQVGIVTGAGRGLGRVFALPLVEGGADEQGGDLIGEAVNRTARLAYMAEGGQIVVSEAAAARVPDEPGGGPGRRRHGFEESTRPERLPAVSAEDVGDVDRPPRPC
jgi:class 3 adenylate cyclase